VSAQLIIFIMNEMFAGDVYLPELTDPKVNVMHCWCPLEKTHSPTNIP